MEEIRSCSVPKKNIRYIENGVDTGRFNPDCDATGVTKEYDLPTDKPLLLFLGRLKGQKRPELLIKRFAKILNALDGDITLTVAGKGARGEAARKMAETHCGDNIKFLGCVPERDKAPLYVAADYYVLPSSYEGSPLALYEALASGTPAIVSDLPGTRFVAEEQCGIVVDFEDDSDVERIAEYISADDGHIILRSKLCRNKPRLVRTNQGMLEERIDKEEREIERKRTRSGRRHCRCRN
jgi:glycosyltransferase involved in cell wall biosynthesis